MEMQALAKTWTKAKVSIPHETFNYGCSDIDEMIMAFTNTIAERDERGCDVYQIAGTSIMHLQQPRQEHASNSPRTSFPSLSRYFRQLYHKQRALLT